MTEVIILGLKDKVTGELKVYDVENNSGRNAKHTSIEVGKQTGIKVLSPYPFGHFSSLDNSANYWKKYNKTYLKVKAELSEDEYKSMKSSGIMYHRFKDREVNLICEVDNPFEVAYDTYKEFGEQLGTYNLVTWVLHDKIRSKKEFEYGKKILWEGVKRNNKNGYHLDISLDEYLIPYLEEFFKMEDKGYKITFGRYGSVEISATQLNKFDLSVTQLIGLYNKTNHNDVLMHKNFSIESVEESEEEEVYKRLTELPLYDEELKILEDSGFSVDRLFRTYFDTYLKMILEHERYDDGSEEGVEYKNYYEYLNDSSIKNYIEHNSPYDFYCCYDCDGYYISDMYTEEELEGVKYTRNERADTLYEALGDYKKYVSLDHELLKPVDKDILELLENKMIGG